MNPADIYTVLVILIVAMVLFSSWCWDRIAEGKKREAELQAEIERLKRRPSVTQYHWPTDVR